MAAFSGEKRLDVANRIDLENRELLKKKNDSSGEEGFTTAATASYLCMIAIVKSKPKDDRTPISIRMRQFNYQYPVKAY